MDKKRRIIERLKRQSGMSLAAREHLKNELHKREWWAKCWNCRRNVEGTIADLQNACPHCGVSLSVRDGKKSADLPSAPAKFRLNMENRSMIREGK